ncbi:pentatricopeptide repeat-containing protein [Tanacetum coccineum]
MALLHDDLKLQQDTRLTLISDGHKGLHDAVRDWLPNSEHRKCTRHIYANFKKKFSGIQLQKLLWHAASCTVPQLFYSKMEEMKQINSEAYDYLIGRDPNSWSRAFFNLSVKCLAFENGYVRAIIKVVAMHNIAVNLEDQITPATRKKLEYLKREQRHWTVFPSAYQLLEVRCGDSAFRVNLDLWFKTYQHSVKPVLGTQIWKRTGNHPSLPPIVRRMPGRPRKERIKAPSENNSQVSRVGRVMRCSNCQGIGHNKASCDKEPVPKAPIQINPPGRTRQYVFGTHASARGHGRGSRGGRGAIGNRNSFGRGSRGGSANKGQQMNEQMDEERERQNKEEREWEERNDYFNPSNCTEDESMDVDAYNRKNSAIKFNAFTQEFVINDPSHPTQSTKVRVGDADVAASAQDIHEGDADVAASA